MIDRSGNKRLQPAPSASLAVALRVVLVAFSWWGAAMASHGAEVLNRLGQLQQQSFWDNRDWDWYLRNIPFFECPDQEITTTYYYRWELLTKHLTYGSPDSGYSFTEFIDRPFWSGAYGAISCPAGHQLYEARWLRSPRYARDYARYWFRTPGAQPRNYSTWLADSVWALHQVHPERSFVVELLPDMIKNYQGWEERHYVPEVGLFWQTGHDDGMEFNINSRQTQDILRGAPGYRPTLNSYLAADATAIAKVARLAGETGVADEYDAKSDGIRRRMLDRLWDERREFFLQAYRDDETREGHQIKALSKTYETGEFAGSDHGRELIGYVPWQFRLPEPGRGYERAWRFLMDAHYFAAPFGPTTVERNDPMFLLKNSCCWWSGQSWPYATTQTLKAMANLLQHYQQTEVTAADYVRLLNTYARSHRKDGRPYLAEALHPDTGSFEGHDGYNHSEHYFHSGFCDLVITGLVGLVPRDDEVLELRPLAPLEWEYWALDGVPYRGRELSIVWDKSGTRYGMGPGLHILADGRPLHATAELGPVTVPLSPVGDEQRVAAVGERPSDVNHGVNNDGNYYPRWTASYTAPGTSLSKVYDGNYWYHRDPPNRWTAAGTPHAEDWIAVDLGEPRLVERVKLYFLADAPTASVVPDAAVPHLAPPRRVRLETWDDGKWMPLPVADSVAGPVVAHRPTEFQIPLGKYQRFRAVIEHAAEGPAGLTEFEIWGEGERPYRPAPPPAGNVAWQRPGQEFPRAAASFSDRFGGEPSAAIDGRICYAATPMNRWTSYESPTAEDWWEVDWGTSRVIDQVVLHLYDDGGGVQAPAGYEVLVWNDQQWRPVDEVFRRPAEPQGSAPNVVQFRPVATAKVRINFRHREPARSGVTEVEVWAEGAHVETSDDSQPTGGRAQP
ncbi:MAG: discoidin domain-containing protein [Pirellulales bacterium]